MKLLVAGDSYAEFPSTDYSYTTNVFTSRIGQTLTNNGVTFKCDFEHWCELIAKTANGSATSVGMPGMDLSSTTFVANKYIIEGNYTHMIFFVTSFLRDCINQNLSLSDKLGIASEYNSPDSQLTNLYNEPLLDTIELYDFTSVSNHDEYNEKRSVLSMTHDKLSNIVMLYTTCLKHNVKPIFVLPWHQQIVEDYLGNENIFHLPNFPYINNENFYKYNAVISHYFDNEHKHIANEFLIQKPTFCKL